MPLLEKSVHEAIPGWAYWEEIQALYEYAMKAPDGNFAELGVWAGRTAIPLALAAQDRNSKLFAIDPWESENVTHRHVSWQMNVAHEIFLTNLKTLDLERYVYIITRPGLHAAAEYPLVHLQPLSLVHIDAVDAGWEHFALLTVWWNLLIPGGYMFVHDVKKLPEGMGHESGRPDMGVLRATERWELLSGVKRHGETLGHWIYRKEK